MKKGIVIACIIAAVAAAGLGIWVFSRPSALGNISRDFSESSSGSSDVTFSLEAGEKLKFSFRSDVKSGELDIILFDSDGNSVYELDRAKELEVFYTLDKTDNYTLAAEYNNFIGDFNIVVYNVD